VFSVIHVPIFLMSVSVVTLCPVFSYLYQVLVELFAFKVIARDHSLDLYSVEFVELCYCFNPRGTDISLSALSK
jgi:hypothetical protein